MNSKKESVISFFNQGNAYLEIPPWVKSGVGKSYYFTTNFTKLLSIPVSLADDNLSSINLSGASGSTIVSSPLVWWNNYRNPTSETDLQFRRNYQGVFSAHSYNNLYKGDIVLAYSHGENKNEIAAGFQYQNTVWPSFLLDTNKTNTFSGDVNGIYNECWESYFGFVNMQWIENTSATQWASSYFWEEGPIAWPSNGYITHDNQKASCGLRHPSSILNNSDSCIYIFFLDTGTTGIIAEEGRDAGIKVVRVKKENAVFPTMYEVYYNGEWYPSLPLGYTKNSMLDYINVKGPKSSVLVGGPNTVRFTVAKIVETNYYLGVEEVIEPITNQVSANLRLSNNLINWSCPKIVLSNASSWEKFKYNYPIFLDHTGWTNTEISEKDFYILGTKSGDPDKIYRMKLSINLLSNDRYENCKSGATVDDGYEIDEGIKTDDIMVAIENDYIIVTFPTNSQELKKKVVIYDAMGKLIKIETFAAEYNNLRIDISEIISSGIYLLNIQTTQNVYSRKFNIN